jgi:cysteine desulfurase/selenocysteine lyase
MDLNVNEIRADFPILQTYVSGKPLIYLDNAATSQKPVQVIDAENKIYRELNSNIHRGVHYLSEQCTQLYENARNEVSKYINAANPDEIIFTSGTTAGINLLAASFGERFVNEGDEIIVSEMEHHSNIVPWQLLCNRKKAILIVLPFDDAGELLINKLDELINSRTRIIALTQVSNVLGTINPIDKVIEKAHKHNIPVLIDGAQGIVHGGIDVQKIDCDFYVFSGHKIYAPTGIGVLYGKKDLLEEMPPWQGGGDMIGEVNFEKTTYAPIPLKFEAGTSNYAAAIALASAINYLKNIGLSDIKSYEDNLLNYAIERLSKINGIRFYGTSKNKSGIISFLLDGAHHYDTSMILDKLGIAVRSGHLCADPIMRHYKINGMVRASFSFYNTFEEVDKLCEGLQKIKNLL